MNNQKTNTRANTTIVSAENHIPARKPAGSVSDTKYRDQFTDMTLDTGRYALHVLKENTGDYKVIGEDQSLSSVERAMGKRKVLAADVGIGLGAAGGTLGLIWLGKQVFKS